MADDQLPAVGHGHSIHTLHPTPYTLHPTPYTLHPTPYTLHPTPYTLGHLQGESIVTESSGLMSCLTTY